VRRRSLVITSEKFTGPLGRLALLSRLRPYHPGSHAKENYQRCYSHFRPLENLNPFRPYHGSEFGGVSLGMTGTPTLSDTTIWQVERVPVKVDGGQT
jgi:hypothetical protein